MCSRQVVLNGFQIMLMGTSMICGNPFKWDQSTQLVKTRSGKLFILSRLCLNILAIWDVSHNIYWWNYGRIHKDQPIVEDIMDTLYAGSLFLTSVLMLHLRFTEKSVLTFINSLVILNRRFEDEIEEDVAAKDEKWKKNRYKNWRWWMTIYLIYQGVIHCSAMGFMFIRNPIHRRYIYGVVFDFAINTWLAFPFAIIQTIRIMHCYEVLILYLETGSFYCRISLYWLREKSYDENSRKISYADSLKVYRSLQVLNTNYNRVFGLSNALLFFWLWLNLLYYCVVTIVGLGVVPCPEYLAFPVVAIGGTGFVLIMIYEMAGVLKGSENFIDGWAVARKSNEPKSLFMLQRTWIKMSSFFKVIDDAVLIYLGNLVDSVVNVLIAT